MFLLSLFVVQLMSSGAQQVASIVQKAESVYWTTLRDLYRHVQEGRHPPTHKPVHYLQPETHLTSSLRCEGGPGCGCEPGPSPGEAGAVGADGVPAGT